MRILSITVSLLLCLLGCDEIDNLQQKVNEPLLIEEGALPSYKYQLTLTKHVALELDSVTAGRITSVNGVFQTNKSEDGIFKDGVTYFHFISNTGTVLFYDTDTKKLHHSINLAKPQAEMFRMPMAAFPISEDSIFIYDFPQLVLINAHGVRLGNTSVFLKEKPLQPLPLYFARPSMIGKTALFGFASPMLPPSNPNTTISKEELSSSLLSINYSNKYLSYIENYPDLYERIQPLARLYYLPDTEIINQEQVLISYPAYPNLIVTDLKGNRTEHFAGSDKFSSIPAKNRQSDEEHYNTNFAYRGTYYDPYRKLIYRFVSLPIREDLLKDPDYTVSKWKKLAVIVLNEDFEKIAETTLPPDFNDSVVFVTEDGLHIWNYQKTFEDEDYLHLGVFKLEMR